ncbi:uncharacterized protein DMAD_10986 [Drosophila madeirensis]|uniref:Uncharacterized protein n=1 Tax=Drosophila madeirensis TaxID=30013 RepID=A0AAU9FBI5_DROMD
MKRIIGKIGKPGREKLRKGCKCGLEINKKPSATPQCLPPTWHLAIVRAHCRRSRPKPKHQDSPSSKEWSLKVGNEKLKPAAHRIGCGGGRTVGVAGGWCRLEFIDAISHPPYIIIFGQQNAN